MLLFWPPVWQPRLRGIPKSVKLPPPYATPSADNGPHVVEQPSGAELKLPKDFKSTFTLRESSSRASWLSAKRRDPGVR